MSDRLSFWSLDLRSDPNPKVARIVIDGQWRGDLGLAGSLLEDVANRWPQNKYVGFLVTCGAFITFDWPTSLPPIVDNWTPDERAFRTLGAIAKKKVSELLSDRLSAKLASHTRYLTIGVDSHKDKISETQNQIPEPHVEFICLVDLKSGQVHLTGKSYPTTGQERGLVRNADLANHIVKTAHGKVLVLGCHDLTIFNPRSRSRRQGRRKKVADSWENDIKNDPPDLIIHHPHTTVKTRTWAASWNELHRLLPSIKLSLGAGRYSMEDAGWGERNALNQVLERTRRGATLDFVAHIGEFRESKSIE